MDCSRFDGRWPRLYEVPELRRWSIEKMVYKWKASIKNDSMMALFSNGLLSRPRHYAICNPKDEVDCCQKRFKTVKKWTKGDRNAYELWQVFGRTHPGHQQLYFGEAPIGKWLWRVWEGNANAVNHHSRPAEATLATHLALQGLAGLLQQAFYGPIGYDDRVDGNFGKIPF